MREPTNQEISLLSYLGISYGAKGMLYFEMNGSDLGFVFPGTNDTSKTYARGLGNLNPQTMTYLEPRYINAYGQQKWKSVSDLNKKIKKIGPYLMSFDNTDCQSYILRLESNSLINETFFTDVLSYKPIESDFPGHQTTPESVSQRYLQVAKFNNPNAQNTKYFMVINRRCSPFYPDSTDRESGIRFVRIKLDSNSSQFSNFNNWSIYDLGNDSLIKTFNKQVASTIDLGWYLPGEGKLYKLAPVMQEGGELVANEVISGVNFNCNDTVLSNGKDITFDGHNTTINFADSATIIMSNASFYVGDNPLNSSTLEKNHFKGLNGHNWNGLRFNECTVRMYDCKFENIASPSVNFAVQLVNCVLGDIRNNVFILNTDTAGGILAAYLPKEELSEFNLYINYNSFTMNNSRTNAIQVQGFSDATLPVYIQHNTMTANGYATGIVTSTITGGVIGYNSISGFYKGMNLMYSSADLYKNIITNESSPSTGIFASSEGSLNLTSSDDYLIGGSNSNTNTAESSNNLEVIGTIF